MYLGIDVGGTKTLVALLDDNGVITEQQKFPTPQKYDDFLRQLEDYVAKLSTNEYRAAGIGIPATRISREEGVADVFANLPWREVAIVQDVEKIVHCPVVMENDAKLGGLSESMLRKEVQRLLYVTISTGVGYSLIVDGRIDTNIGDNGGKTLLIEHDGKLTPWEQFGSGRAIVEKYAKQAHEITDIETWKQISRNIAAGLLELIAVCEPKLIVIGGSVGAYFERYGALLNAELKQYETPLLPIPAVEGAKRANEAVIYGCYDYAKEVFVH